MLDGYLVDYEAVKIKSDVKINGAFLTEGELVGEVDTETGKETLDELEDEREFSSADIEVKITALDSTEKIIKAIKKYTDQHEEAYGRFPKTLIFAVNDLPNISHADEVVRTCKEVFGKGDDFVLKITGSPTVDRPLQKIRQFRNCPDPHIVVKVDMLSTGVDIPAIEFVVFMRMVKSRILWVQMLGRGTRRCDEINKEKFTIFDCFDGSLIEYFKGSTDFEVSLQKESAPISEIIERIYDNRTGIIISIIEILLSRPKNWSADTLEDLRRKLKVNDFDEKILQRAYGQVYKKPLADIISMIKHAADFQVPILTAEKRVNLVMERITEGKVFTEEQRNRLSYIREHLIKNLAISGEDFETMPFFERHGGLGKAQKVFGDKLEGLIQDINLSIAA